MNRKTLVDYLSAQPGAVEDYPFGPTPQVFKVAGKMFALVSPDSLNLKCDPHEAMTLRDAFEGVTPGYHMNKKHWNTVVYEGSDVPDEQVLAMVDHSYRLICKALPKAKRPTSFSR